MSDLFSKAKFYADDTSLFFTKHDMATTANELNNYLKKISDWVVQGKTNFHPELSKQTQKVIFSRKL